MKYKILAILIIITAFIATFTGCVEEQEPHEKSLSEITIEFMTEIKKGDLSSAHSYFSSEMKSQFSIVQFQNTWDSITSLYGNFKSIVDTSESVEGGFDIIFVNCTFSNNYYIIFKVVFNDTALISGFWTEKIEPISTYSTPSYADVTSFIETEITIGQDPWLLPGTISIPKHDGLFPCVVLVHGSGPSDRDETIGANKPFKDIAWGLSSNEIIVLRYDKRTKVYPEELAVLKNLTLEEEIIEDVFAAIDFLKSIEKADQNRIFVLGHSLGAMATPQIAFENENIFGVIMLAAPGRGLEDLIYNQTIYLAELDGIIDENEFENIELVNESRKKIQSLNITDDEQVLGAYKSYWEYLNNYDPVKTAESLTIPMMILQGLRDYQVTYEDDYLVWNATFSNNSNVFLKTYDELNHLFIAGVGAPTNTEYLTEGNVAEEVIEDITILVKGDI
jgi:esterase/lipase